MKDFRVISITESNIKKSNQKILIIELSEVEYSDYNLPSGKQTYNFGLSGEKFVFDFNSKLCDKITEAANTENIVSLDMSDFTVFDDNQDLS